MFERYAVYYTFEGTLAARGGAWLGWDIATGAHVASPQIDGIDLPHIRARPQKYGFHATIKAPFVLAHGANQDALAASFVDTCKVLRPVSFNGLRIAQIGRFLALIPEIGDSDGLKELAKQVVQKLDPFRAPLSEQDLARRQRANLSEQQSANLLKWGYPHVMEAFQFHVTLTGGIKDAALPATLQAARAYFEPALPVPFVLDSLTLVGQSSDGHFKQIIRQAFSG